MRQTPLQKLVIGGRTVLLKREDLNPLGSHKGYAVRHFMDSLGSRYWSQSRRQQLLVSSSGRFVGALAAMTQQRNVDIHLVTDVLSPSSLCDDLKRFPHITVERLDEADETGSHIKARLQRMEVLQQETPELRLIDQYNEPAFPEGYRKYFGNGLTNQLGRSIGAVFAPAGTGGMANGLCRYRDDVLGAWPLFVVDAMGSALLRTPPLGVKRRLSGYGNGFQTGLIEQVRNRIEPVWVSDTDAVLACHQLRACGVWLGPSSGAVVAAFGQVLNHRPALLPQSDPIVLICPDSGAAYADTIFNSQYLLQNGFDIPDISQIAA